MKRPLAIVGTLAVTVGVLAGTMIAPAVGASSHREAPSISKDPSADNTDVYAFVTPGKADTVTLVAPARRDDHPEIGSAKRTQGAERPEANHRRSACVCTA